MVLHPDPLHHVVILVVEVVAVPYVTAHLGSRTTTVSAVRGDAVVGAGDLGVVLDALEAAASA